MNTSVILAFAASLIATFVKIVFKIYVKNVITKQNIIHIM